MVATDTERLTPRLRAGVAREHAGGKPLLARPGRTPVGVISASDIKLMAECCRGREAALGELYDRHGRVAHGLAFRMLRDHQLAEDVLQEAFMALWREAFRYDPTRISVRSWLLCLVHNKAVNCIRAEKRRQRPLVPQGLPLDDRDHAADIALGDDATTIQTALGRLSANQRHVLTLAYFEGLTQSQIATRLDLPIGTIKSRTHAGLARLGQLVERPLHLGAAPAPDDGAEGP